MTTYLYLSWETVIPKRAMVPVPDQADLAAALIDVVEAIRRNQPMPTWADQRPRVHAGPPRSGWVRLHGPEPSPVVWLETDPTRGWISSVALQTDDKLHPAEAAARLRTAGYLPPESCQVRSGACGDQRAHHRCDEVAGHRYGEHHCSCGEEWL